MNDLLAQHILPDWFSERRAQLRRGSGTTPVEGEEMTSAEQRKLEEQADEAYGKAIITAREIYAAALEAASAEYRKAWAAIKRKKEATK